MSLRIAFLHPDLGIGGAERLVVDAAVAMQSKGHRVVIYTSHHDPKHCFEETRNGTLDVRVRGDWLPRMIFGRFYILCAILRQLVLAISLLTYERNRYDVLFIDQLSACIPLLKLFSSSRVLFYCHHPDKLLTKRTSLLKKAYRWPVDQMEEWTTGLADCIVVNSLYTGSVFQREFPSIHKTPKVLYPAINLDAYDRPVDLNDPSVQLLQSSQKTLLSINRFERKKCVELALRAFAGVANKVTPDVFKTYRLVIAGGYDPRVTENVEYLQELNTMATTEFGLKTHIIHPHDTQAPPSDAQVVFLCSFNDAQRTFLLSTSDVLLYTPSLEHFGITPVEGMYARLPVIAVNNGGPMESVKHEQTGLLVPAETAAWTDALSAFIHRRHNREAMGEAGRHHVENTFSLTAFGDQLDNLLQDLMQQPKATNSLQTQVVLALVVALVGFFYFRFK